MMELVDRLKALSKQNLGVEWTLPGKKRRFATSTKATSDLASLLAECGHTFITGRDAVNYDPELHDILSWFIEKGCGDCHMSDHIS